MSCPFYGRRAIVAHDGGHLMTPPMVDAYGHRGQENDCALIVRLASPCMMESALGLEPDAATCELLRTAALVRELYEATSRRAVKFVTEATTGESVFQKLRAGLEAIEADTETAGSDSGIPHVAKRARDLIAILPKVDAT